jgi:hypothetical protein
VCCCNQACTAKGFHCSCCCCHLRQMTSMHIYGGSMARCSGAMHADRTCGSGWSSSSCCSHSHVMPAGGTRLRSCLGPSLPG